MFDAEDSSLLKELKFTIDFKIIDKWYSSRDDAWNDAADYEKNSLTDEEFNFLLTLMQEYDYILADNVLCIDRNPSFLEGKINDAFVEDYASHLNIKFYVLYEYQKVENV